MLCVVQYKKKNNFGNPADFRSEGIQSATLKSTNTESYPTLGGASASMIQNFPPLFRVPAANLGEDFSQISNDIFAKFGINSPNIGSYSTLFDASTSRLPATYLGEEFQSFSDNFGSGGVPSGILNSSNIWSYATSHGVSPSMLPATLGNEFQGFGDNFSFEGASSVTLNSANIWSNPTPVGASTSMIQQVPPIHCGAFEPTNYGRRLQEFW